MKQEFDMKRNGVLVGAAVLVMWFTAGCETALPVRSDADWAGGRKESAEWALKCDSCGKIYAHHVYTHRVTLERHRKWAAGEGNVSAVRDGKPQDLCSTECKEQLLGAESDKATKAE